MILKCIVSLINLIFSNKLKKKNQINKFPINLQHCKYLAKGIFCFDNTLNQNQDALTKLISCS